MSSRHGGLLSAGPICRWEVPWPCRFTSPQIRPIEPSIEPYSEYTPMNTSDGSGNHLFLKENCSPRDQFPIHFNVMRSSECRSLENHVDGFSSRSRRVFRFYVSLQGGIYSILIHTDTCHGWCALSFVCGGSCCHTADSHHLSCVNHQFHEHRESTPGAA